MTPRTAAWQPKRHIMRRLDALIQRYRRGVVRTLEPIVRAHYPDLLAGNDGEYRKMLELSTKMTVVGHASAQCAGYRYDARRRRIACLYGSCCFLADSFVDDFGEPAALQYLDRFEALLATGWFEVRTDRERLFYVIVARLFAERDVFTPVLRQAILSLYEAQRRDVELRLPGAFVTLPRRRQLRLLQLCARDRSGHAICVLSAFLAPQVSLAYLNLIFAAGALIMHIDDHGDCYSDRRARRVTYMNCVGRPARVLRRIFTSYVDRLFRGFPPGPGRDLLIAFLVRYYVTRLEKHRQQRRRGASSWAVYE
jgi:hypothetical protein